jgi:hypothetical protein
MISHEGTESTQKAFIELLNTCIRIPREQKRLDAYAIEQA